MAMKPRKVGEGLYQPLAEINVTPLVDVMLVLLIIFMVTAPLLASGIKVNLPSARTAEPLEAKNPVVVSRRQGRRRFGRQGPGRARRTGGDGQEPGSASPTESCSCGATRRPLTATLSQ